MFETNFLFETPKGKELEIEISRITNQTNLENTFLKVSAALGADQTFEFSEPAEFIEVFGSVLSYEINHRGVKFSPTQLQVI